MIHGRERTVETNENKQSLFREKNLKQATAPEQLDTYLKVTSYSAWFAVAAAALVLCAVFLWVFCGRISDVITGAGYCRDKVLTCYFPQKEIAGINIGDSLEVSGTACRIEDVKGNLYLDYDIPNEVLFLLPESKWYCTVTAAADLPDGLYSAQYEKNPIVPASYLTKGE